MYNPFNKPTAYVQYEKYKNADKNRTPEQCRNELKNKAKHNFRLDNTKPMYPEKTELNEILIDSKIYGYKTPDGKSVYGENGEERGDYDFVKEIEEKIDERGIKPRKDAVIAVGVIMEVTGGWEQLPQNFDVNKWKEDSLHWLEEKWGKENIVSAVLHVDEFTPHIHAIVTPITSDGRLSCRDWIPGGGEGKKVLSDMQKEYFNAVKQDGIAQCKSGQKAPFSGRDSQRKAQNALNSAGEIDIVPERKPGENDKEYQSRVTEEVQTFSMQKHLELENEFRKMQAENDRIMREKEEAEEAKIKAEKDKEYYKEQAKKEKEEKEFYVKQLIGSGIPRSALKEASELTSALEKKHEEELKVLKSVNTQMRETSSYLSKENEELKQKLRETEDELGTYKKAITANGITKRALANHRNMEDILYAIDNGYPRAEDVKREMIGALKWGKGIKDKEKSR